MSYATCPITCVNINQNQKEDLMRFEISAISNYKHYKEIEIRSRVRISILILLISVFIFITCKFRNYKIIIETLSNTPLMVCLFLFILFTIKYYYKNLFKSKRYVQNLNKALKGFNLYLDNKSLKLCVIGGLRKEE
ncbi:hypothetical protein MKS88_000981 [Plasmodium brasilianum]|uniref:Uncharacterized protein n=2 Tax=Plasmodium (Plasmodium) TaxID=418103 RepID=A0A1D3JIW4_PLAMA|nr:conserved Plasmodium protein, unknown function [Plasmodium malariae]KAI4840746.1 hypothetical protein MKS88_000981 [Plasmodium brasilianum]SBT86313.1 conserved Plasmodium protein, unknown function [Plasmodium malariae]